MGIQNPQLKQNVNYYVGNTLMVKSTFVRTEQKAIEDEEQIDNHNTLMPHRHGREGHQPEQIQPNVGAPLQKAGYEDEGMHRHSGHPDSHPVRLRHRKGSADPLHKEEDGLVDQWKDLYDKAQQGLCTPQELQQLEQIRGRVGELNASRASDAERILGISAAMKMIRKAEDLVGNPVHVVSDSPKKFEVKLEEKDESWRNKASEYGDPEPKDILPNNNGYKDQEDHSESVWGTPPKGKAVSITFPDTVEKKSILNNAIAVTQNVQRMLTNNWGINPGDGRFSDPFLISKFVDAGTPAEAVVYKHETATSRHADHMTNGGGWAVKLNPNTKRFIAYQRESGDMTKREAQTEALGRNKANQDERDNNDMVNNNLPGNPLKTNPKPLYREPRLQVKG